MEEWQRHLVGQIVDQADDWAGGAITTKRLLENVNGLMDAADLRGRPEWAGFYARWIAIDTENDLLSQPWAPAGSGSKERLAAHVRDLRDWAMTARASSDIRQP